MAAPKFVHLHVHSEYSLLDGFGTPKNMIKHAKAEGMEALALTDHGTMYGAAEFYKHAKTEGVKPLIGVEAYITNGDHRARGKENMVETNHLILLSKNEEGYRNLMKLTSIAHLEGYYYRPKVNKEVIKKYSKGIICTSGCITGEIASLILADNYSKAKETAEWFQEVFGDDYYLEIQRHEYENHVDKANSTEIKNDMRRMAKNEKTIEEGVIKLSRELGLPIVATNDSHYIKADDADAQDVLVCVATGKLVSETKRIRYIDNPNFYIKSPDEMVDLFPDLPEAIENTVKVADKCDLEISTYGKWFFPIFPLEDKTADIQLRNEVKEKLPLRYKEVTKEIEERINHELDIIIGKGYSSYFLIMSDMVEWAFSQGIITNTRGSAAGSIVSYILGITTVDPLYYNLPFERFLNPFRPSPPDIDLDISDNRREEMINYITEKYGKNKVAQICTFGRMLARAAVRDVARVLGYPYATGDRIAKLIPPPKQGFPVDVPKALKDSPELKSLYDNDADTRKILDLAHKLEGSARHISVHAAGVVVSPTDMTDFTPIQLEAGGEKVITQYEMHACEEVGLIKFDMLGIRNLATLALSIKLVKDARGEVVDIRNIPLDNKKTFEMLARGETMGVFQMGSTGMTKWLKDLKPERIEDLMAMVALYRPGPMQTISNYIYRKEHPEEIKYLDPRMEKFLDKSYGLIVYQDDLLFCALDLAGYSWEEADKFRKAVGKKIPEEMAAQKEKLTKGLIANGQTEEFAETLWKLFEPFQAYGFNKCLVGSTTLYEANTGERMSIESLYGSKKKVTLLSVDENNILKPKPISAIHQNGVKPVFEVTTRRGMKIKSTDNHQFLTFKGWKELKDLEVGSRIATPRFAPLPQEPYSVPDYQIATLGYLLAEGNLCHPSGVYFYSTSKEEIDDFIFYANYFGNSQIKLNHTKPATSVYMGRKDIKRPNELRDWLSDLGMLNKKATQKKFPEFSFGLNINQLSLLLAKMWQGDGLVNAKDGGQLFYATSSEELANEMQHLLLRLGIISTIHKKGFKYRGGIKIGWTINISRHNNISRFAETIGNYLLGDIKASLKIIMKNHPIISGTLSSVLSRGSKDLIPAGILSIVKEEIYKTGSNLASFASQNGFSVRSFAPDKRKTGYLRETIQAYSQKLDSQKLSSLGNSDIYWDEIVAITPNGREMTYDLTIPETHNFVANDIIVHNSHAASYGIVAYQTAYMKANYPIEFMCALLTDESGDPEKVAQAVAECRRMGIKVLAPDINKSQVGFTIEDTEDSLEGKAIRFGLSAIKNVGTAAIETMIDARSKGPFRSFGDFFVRVDTRKVNRKILESLIKAGALDGFGARAALLAGIDAIKNQVSRLKKAEDGQDSLFSIGQEEEEIEEVVMVDNLPIVDDFTRDEKLALERELLGLYLSEHPLASALATLGGRLTHKIGDLSRSSVGQTSILAGMIAASRVVTIKNSGKQMAFATLEDETGTIEMVIFPQTFAKTRIYWDSKQPVVINGKAEYREDALSLIVDKVRTIEEVLATAEEKVVEMRENIPSGAQMLRIPRGTSSQALLELNNLLKSNKGDSDLTILVENGFGEKRIKVPYGVAWGPRLQSQIKKLLS